MVDFTQCNPIYIYLYIYINEDFEQMVKCLTWRIYTTLLLNWYIYAYFTENNHYFSIKLVEEVKINEYVSSKLSSC